MSLTVTPCLVLTFCLVGLLLALVSFSTFKAGPIPEQDISPHSGFVVWHPPLEGFNTQIFYSVSTFVGVSNFFAGYCILKWVKASHTSQKHITYFVLDNAKTASTDRFNYFMGIYCIITAWAGISLVLFDVGKIWVSTGVLHNGAEAFVLLFLHQGGKISSTGAIGFWMFYVLTATTLSIFLDWPNDAVWFKMQGLCIDYSLLIQFTRTYFNTKHHLRDNLLEGNPINEEEGLVETTREHPQSDRQFGLTINHPRQLLLLIFASLSHVIGNSIQASSNDNISLISFLLTYSITYPCYAFFIYLNYYASSAFPHKLIYLPDTTRWKVVAVVIAALACSLSVVRIIVTPYSKQ